MHTKLPSGFSLIEVLVAVSMLAIMIIYATGEFKTQNRDRLRERVETSGSQVEEVIRREIAARLRAHYRAIRPACLQSTSPLVPQLAGSMAGIQFSHLGGAGALALKDEAIGGTTAPFRALFNRALDRCSASMTTAMPNNLLATPVEGVHFCMRFSPGPAYQGGQNDILTTMQPVIVEFFFSNSWYFKPLGAPPLPNVGVATCTQTGQQTALAPPGATMGMLYYMIYWSAPSDQGVLHSHQFGVVATGNG